MSSIVSICNLALSNVNARRIQSLSDTMKEARECALHYDMARDAVLAGHDWTFARKRLTLALLSETYSGWTYAYMYPSDCIELRHIYDGVGAPTNTSYDFSDERFRVVDRVKYEVAMGDGYRVILTNEASAELRYTARVTDPNMYTPKFITALGYQLAMKLSIPLKADPKRMANMSELYDREISQAQTTNSNSEYNPKKPIGSFIQARG